MVANVARIWLRITHAACQYNKKVPEEASGTGEQRYDWQETAGGPGMARLTSPFYPPLYQGHPRHRVKILRTTNRR
jgi:hypothetical protein